jgi:hypothetical protein
MLTNLFNASIFNGLQRKSAVKKAEYKHSKLLSVL